MLACRLQPVLVAQALSCMHMQEEEGAQLSQPVVMLGPDHVLPCSCLPCDSKHVPGTATTQVLPLPLLLLPSRCQLEAAAGTTQG